MYIQGYNILFADINLLATPVSTTATLRRGNVIIVYQLSICLVTITNENILKKPSNQKQKSFARSTNAWFAFFVACLFFNQFAVFATVEKSISFDIDENYINAVHIYVYS